MNRYSRIAPGLMFEKQRIVAIHRQGGSPDFQQQIAGFELPGRKREYAHLIYQAGEKLVDRRLRRRTQSEIPLGDARSKRDSARRHSVHIEGRNATAAHQRQVGPDIGDGHIGSKRSETTEQALVSVVRGNDNSPTGTAGGTPRSAIVNNDLASPECGFGFTQHSTPKLSEAVETIGRVAYAPLGKLTDKELAAWLAAAMATSFA